MRTIDYEWTPETVAEGRLGLHGFLANPRGAAVLWEREIAANVRPIWVPPEARGRSSAVTGRWLARAYVEQVGKARLFLLDEGGGDLAVRTGADARLDGFVDDGAPPRPYGLLVSRAGRRWDGADRSLLGAS